MQITGSLYKDERGTLAFVNGFTFPEVKRFYTLTHPNTDVVRAWQGHRRETKYFFVSRGAFLLARVRPDNWEHPRKDLPVERFELRADVPTVLCISAGYANGFRALEAGSILTVFSDLDLEASTADLVRFDPGLWQL